MTMMVIVDELKKKKKEKLCLCSDSNLGLRRYEADVYPNAPFGHGRSSLDFERGAWTHKIRQESRAPLRLTTTMAGREACFVRNRMAKGQSQSRCDQMSKLRASQSESTPSQSPNSDDNQATSQKKASLSTIVVARRRGARFLHGASALLYVQYRYLASSSWAGSRLRRTARCGGTRRGNDAGSYRAAAA